MGAERQELIAFLRDVLERGRVLPSRFASEIGVSHATVSRWLRGQDVPSPRSCHKVAVWTGVPLERVLSLSGHLPPLPHTDPADWPEFREYAQRKYSQELDEDLITMIEDLIERRRRKSRA